MLAFPRLSACELQIVSGRGQMPVINVSWGDAKRYVGWLSQLTGGEYRLPTGVRGTGWRQYPLFLGR
jgi:formylglycine-generating enzyme required for sulfatase activity